MKWPDLLDFDPSLPLAKWLWQVPQPVHALVSLSHAIPRLQRYEGGSTRKRFEQCLALGKHSDGRNHSDHYYGICNEAPGGRAETKTQVGVAPVPLLCHRPLPGGPCPLPSVLGPRLWLLPSRRWPRAAGSSRAWPVAWGPAATWDFVFPFHLLALPCVEVPE